MTDTHSRSFHVGTYENGQPYQPARGRYAPRRTLEDRLTDQPPVMDIKVYRPSPVEFLDIVADEMVARWYMPRTIRTYRRALTNFLAWCGRPPHQVTREHVRQYLELLVRGRGSHAWVCQNLLAIRVAFDKLCGGSLTLGLVTPKRPKRLPVILSTVEVARLLQAAPSLRDKLLLGLLYATGVKASELVRLRWRDVDFEHRTVMVWEGIGRDFRQVMLPTSFTPLLAEQAKLFGPDDYLFPADKPGKHLSARAVARAMQRAVLVAGIGKRVSTMNLRHSFAVHLIDSGTDIRYVQTLLGHVKLETTTIYSKVAYRHDGQEVASPLDALCGKVPLPSTKDSPEPVGRVQIRLKPRPDRLTADVTLTILGGPRAVRLDGIVAREARPGWIVLDVPPLEAWAEPFRWLTPQQRSRIEAPAFFTMLKDEVTRRFPAVERRSG